MAGYSDEWLDREFKVREALLTGALEAAERQARQQVREALEKAEKDIHWLLEFVVEPEFFPNQGDRQYWHERLAAIAALREGRDA